MLQLLRCALLLHGLLPLQLWLFQLWLLLPLQLWLSSLQTVGVEVELELYLELEKWSSSALETVPRQPATMAHQAAGNPAAEVSLGRHI